MNCADIKVALSVLNEQEKEFERLIEELSDKEDKEGELSWIDKNRRDTTWKIIECYRKVASDLAMTYTLTENHEREELREEN